MELVSTVAFGVLAGGSIDAVIGASIGMILSAAMLAASSRRRLGEEP